MTPDQSTTTSTDQHAGMDALAAALKVCFRLLIVILLAALLLFIWKSFFVVEQHEYGLVLRFGNLVGRTADQQVMDKGLHMTLPAPFDVKIRVPKRVQSVESTSLWYATEVQDPDAPLPRTLRPGVDGYSLTGDNSIIHSKWVLRYVVNSPVDYAFAFTGQPGDFSETNRFLRILLDASVTEVCSTMSIDEAWANREQLSARVEDALRRRLDGLALGIDLGQLEVLPLEVAPPKQVGDVFQAATQAAEEKQRIIEQAKAYASSVESNAETEELGLLGEARSYQQEQDKKAQANRDYFLALKAQYDKNPPLVRRSLYHDSMRRILPQIGETFVIKSEDGQELRLLLNREPDEIKK